MFFKKCLAVWQLEKGNFVVLLWFTVDYVLSASGKKNNQKNLNQKP